MKVTKYPIIEVLPAGAVKVSQYATDNDITVAYVYIRHTRGKADYSIYQYQGINFVVPNAIPVSVS